MPKAAGWNACSWQTDAGVRHTTEAHDHGKRQRQNDDGNDEVDQRPSFNGTPHPPTSGVRQRQRHGEEPSLYSRGSRDFLRAPAEGATCTLIPLHGPAKARVAVPDGSSCSHDRRARPGGSSRRDAIGSFLGRRHRGVQARSGQAGRYAFLCEARSTPH